MADPVVIAIPAQNEAERLPLCLGALAAQRDVPVFDVVVLLNNCSDDSETLVRSFCGDARLRVHPVVRRLPPHRAFAGTARRLAMAHAARLAGPHGSLLTTDADTVAPPDWVAGNLRALAAGVDAVAGRAVIDPVEAARIPAALHEADARECAYAALIDEIAAILDPDPADPWPRHDEHSGASIAVTVAAFARAGGIPAVPLGEDRAFLTALRRVDARVRHAPEVWVTVSGRIEGRAKGGMADTIRRRMLASDLMIDDRLEPAADAANRARLRAAARALHHAGYGPTAALARALRLPEVTLVRTLYGGGHFGAAWDAIEACAPALRRRRMPVSELEAQIVAARHIRDSLLTPRRDDPGGIPLVSPA